MLGARSAIRGNNSSTPELIGVSRGGMGPAYFLAGAIPAVSMFTSRRAAPG